MNDQNVDLLRACGMTSRRRTGPGAHPALEWARSGAMSLTGEPGAAPRLAPAPLASAARAALLALEELAGADWRGPLDAPALLGERAALLGLERRGGIAAGGSCRLLRAADGWLALNLARADDVDLLPAWLGEGDWRDPWSAVAAHVRSRSAATLVERARLLGMAAAPACAADPHAPPWYRLARRGPRVAPGARPLVLDLSSLWAGPLCAQLLGHAGARVIKVESLARPDGARRGSPDFYSLLNGRKESVALDFANERDLDRLAALIARADIVIESSRPRALAQLGIVAEDLVETHAGLTWVGISGYGRCEPGASWIAFGDDAAVAAGLAVATGGEGPPLFCGDAIADPLTGLHAAVAALASFRAGGGRLLDLSLRDVIAHLLALAPGEGAELRESEEGWQVATADGCAAVAAPRARRVVACARPLGADTNAVLEELVGPC